MAFEEDLDIFFADFAVNATFNGETVKVIFDTPDQIIAEGMSISTEYQITYPAGSFPGLAYGDAVTIGGETYTAHPPQAIEDGQLFVARLTKE